MVGVSGQVLREDALPDRVPRQAQQDPLEVVVGDDLAGYHHERRRRAAVRAHGELRAGPLGRAERTVAGGHRGGRAGWRADHEQGADEAGRDRDDRAGQDLTFRHLSFPSRRVTAPDGAARHQFYRYRARTPRSAET